jgi:hypothetical protein
MKRTKIISFITSVICVMNIITIPVSAEDYISIASSDDLITLARNCISDSYSVGKTVVLKNDIDLTGSDFETIPSFGGTFDGAGYTIRGVDLQPVDSTRGFIGTVSETGEVKNLNLDGSISPKNETKKDGMSKITGMLNNNKTSSVLDGIERYVSDDGIKSIGGIAGENRGKIVNCTFSGTVKGSENIGGIVGENAQNGRIECCTNAATVTGNTNTGGIAGRNDGVIKWSTNNGLVNPTANEEAQNTGGIAGRSYGAVIESVNNAEIGYKNAGYNTGGITGCQNGYITECTNKGHIQGRKDIGGITGQFEPYTNIDFSQDEIQKRIDENVENLKSDLRSADKNVTDKYNSIVDDIRNFTDKFGWGNSGSSLSNAVGNVSDSLADANTKISDSISDATGNISGSLADASDKIGDAGTRLGNASETIADAGNRLTDSLSDTSQRLSDRLDDSGENLDSAVNDVVEILSAVSDSAEAIRNETTDTTDSLITFLDTANDSLKSGSGDTEKLIKTMIDKIDESEVKLNGVDVDVNMSGLSSSLRSITKNLNNNIDDISAPLIRAAEALDGILDDIASKKETLNNASEELNKILEELDKIQSTTAPSDDTSSSDTPSINLPISPDSTTLPIVVPTNLPINSDNVQNIMDIIGKLFGLLHTTAYAEENETSTLKKLMDMDIRDMDIKINRKVGGETMDAALIKYCINEGEVDGLSDIGGIAGAVGFDSSAKPDENLNVSGDYSLNPSTAIKAIINASINEGDITAKNTSAGGIVGFADLGTVKQSISNGDITVTDGNYAGGIAGYSSNNITKSISMSDIKSAGYAGGIAGKGTNIDTCYALTRIDSDGEKLGAIAGYAEGNIKYNYFLDEGLSGIDGVDYTAKAQPQSEAVMVSTGELSKDLTGFTSDDWVVGTDGRYLPQLKALAENDASGISETLKVKSADFARFVFKVRFFDDGDEIRSMTLNYGDRIPEKDIPKLEKHSGTYGDWDKDTTQKIIRNTDFHSVYEHSTTTIAFGSEPAVLLVEGNFRPGTILDVQESTANVIEKSGYTMDKKYTFTITEDVGEYTDDVTVRVMDKSGKGIIGVIDDGTVNIVDSEIDGSYIKFEMAKPGEFVILHKKPNYLMWIGIGMAGAILIAAAVLLLIKKRKQR